MYLKKARQALFEGGVRQLSTLITTWQKNKPIFAFFYQIQEKIIGFSLLLDFLIKIDDACRYNPPGPAITDLLKQVGLEYELVGDQNILTQNNQSLIILGLNHRTYLEPFLALCLASSQHQNLISLKIYEKLLSPNFSHLVLPLVPRRDVIDRKRNIVEKIVAKIHPIRALMSMIAIDEKQAQIINQSTLTQAQKKLSQNEVLILFPAGSRPMVVDWGKSLAVIVQNLKENKLVDTYIQPVFFEYQHKKDLYKIILFNLRHKKVVKKIKIKIYLQKAQTLTSLDEQLNFQKNSTDIAKILQKYYFRKFSKQIKNDPNERAALTKFNLI